MAVLFPAIFSLSFSSKKFACFDFDVAQLFLAVHIQDLEEQEQWWAEYLTRFWWGVFEKIDYYWAYKSL